MKNLICSVFLTSLFINPLANAEDGVSKNQILIGESTNNILARSKSLYAGAHLFFSKLNARGGVNGRKIEIIMLDDNYVPKKAVENVKQLIEKDKVFALFQIYGTNGVAAVLPLVEAADIPLIAPGSGSDNLRNPVRKNVFNVRNSYFTEASNIIDFVIHKKGISEVCLFNQDDTLGADGSASTAKALAEIGKKIKISATYKRMTEDVSEALNYIKTADCKAVILWSQLAPSLAFLNKAKEVKFKPLIIAASHLSAAEFYSQAGKLSDNLYMSSSVPLTNGSGKSDAFIRKFLEDAGTQPLKSDPSFFQGYLDAAILTHAIRLGGKELTRNSLREAFDEKMQNVKFGKIKVNYSHTDHQGLDKIYLVKVNPTTLEPVK